MKHAHIIVLGLAACNSYDSGLFSPTFHDQDAAPVVNLRKDELSAVSWPTPLHNPACLDPWTGQCDDSIPAGTPAMMAAGTGGSVAGAGGAGGAGLGAAGQPPIPQAGNGTGGVECIDITTRLVEAVELQIATMCPEAIMTAADNYSIACGEFYVSLERAYGNAIIKKMVPNKLAPAPYGTVTCPAFSACDLPCQFSGTVASNIPAQQPEPVKPVEVDAGAPPLDPWK